MGIVLCNTIYLQITVVKNIFKMLLKLSFRFFFRVDFLYEKEISEMVPSYLCHKWSFGAAYGRLLQHLAVGGKVALLFLAGWPSDKCQHGIYFWF